ncbi:hypothetical protein [Deinococcus sp. JMULE3]|uniref:hypothetical protein n=1 Tax=Deinococcus sp. JMULE3 TaxID=2518341 RepID=UPI00157576E3|nr:hypothetical protein [Deinococcus sp. JMULE3]NTX99275.1 hypothetical protein [Deinococcus sp. JMULE3]
MKPAPLIRHAVTQVAPDPAPDAYLTEELRAPPTGVGLVTRPGLPPALTWNGQHVGSAQAVQPGLYRVTPSLSASPRLLGALVSTAQLTALAERFAQTAAGPDLTGQRDRTLVTPLPLRAALPLSD